jgi:hypothetical protein
VGDAVSENVGMKRLDRNIAAERQIVRTIHDAHTAAADLLSLEPLGGSRQPTGKQLLTAAFLNEEPNHP